MEPDRRPQVVIVGAGFAGLEAAKILGCAESTVSWRVHMARKALKERTNDDDMSLGDE